MIRFRTTLVVFLLLFLSSQTRALFVPTVVIANSQTEIEYQLPYPGVLPDSPWYFFKVVRDKMTLLFVRNQPERSFYELFLADKKIAAAESLVMKEKFPLAAVTAMKAEEQLKNAANYNFKKKSNIDLLSKLVVSQTKHREILAAILRNYSSRETAKAWDDNEFVHNRIMNVLLLKK